MNKTAKFLLIFFILVSAASAAVLYFWDSGHINFSLKGKTDRSGEPLPEKLKNPPAVVKTVYATSWSAGNEAKINYLVDLIKKTELNAIIIDIKDYSGYIAFETNSPLIGSIGSEKVQIPNLNKLINKLHQENIYVIARITVFQDPVLAEKRPELAVKSKKTGKIWKDRKGLAWLDPASPEVWNYILILAKEADSRGFDELNFDYIRFPSDGDLNDLVFPFYDEKKPMAGIIKEFFQYLSSNLRPGGVKISADLFGLSTINKDDLGIGQVIEDAAFYFDFVCPMVYPSHYASGFLGYQNPAAYPYEVIKYSMENAVKRLAALNLAQAATSSAVVSPTPFPKIAQLRPWLQDFDLGADYNEKMVRLEKQAVVDAGVSNGWMLWDPKNIYTTAALDLEQK